MKEKHESRRQAAVGQDLARVASRAFGEFFLKACFAAGERPGQPARRDKKGQQQGRSHQAAKAKNESSLYRGCDRPATCERMGAIGGVGHQAGEQQTKEQGDGGRREHVQVRVMKKTPASI